MQSFWQTYAARDALLVCRDSPTTSSRAPPLPSQCSATETSQGRNNVIGMRGEGITSKLALLLATLLVASLVSAAAAQCQARVLFRVSAPNVTTSAVTSGTVRTEGFNSTGALNASGPLAVGSYPLTGGNASVVPSDQFGGTGSSYLGIQPGASLSVSFGTRPSTSGSAGVWVTATTRLPSMAIVVDPRCSSAPSRQAL
jgi:hypothetical protein